MRSSTVLAIATSVLLATTTLARAEGQGQGQGEGQGDDSAFAKPAPTFAPMVQAAGGFGAPTQWVLTMSTAPGGGSFFLHKVSGGTWAVNLQPALDYFLTDRVSVGGVVGIGHVSGDEGTTTVSLGARAGFNLNLIDRLGLWPTGGLFIAHTSLPHDSNTATSLALYAPFLYHLAPHLFVGAGPSFQHGLSGGDYTLYGLDVTIGGWI